MPPDSDYSIGRIAPFIFSRDHANSRLSQLSAGAMGQLLRLREMELESGRYPTSHGQIIVPGIFDESALYELRFFGLATVILKRGRGMKFLPAWVRTTWAARRLLEAAGRFPQHFSNAPITNEVAK